jgi:hypothetical protein
VEAKLVCFVSDSGYLNLEGSFGVNSIFIPLRSGFLSEFIYTMLLAYDGRQYLPMLE